jgi:hypothetical protein
MKKLLFAALLVLLAAPAYAQVAINPTTVTWTVSTDDAATGLDGNPIVTRYELRASLSTAPTVVVSTQNLLKPTPAAGTDTATLAAAFLAALTKNVQYVAKIAAIGPAGEGLSAASNPFGVTGPPAAPTAVVIK